MASERLSPDTEDDIELLFHWHRYQAVAAWVEGLAVLDVGSGDGYGAWHLASRAAAVTAVDGDPAAVVRAAARYRRPNLRFVAGSATALPFAAASFDVVTMFELIEHLPGEEQPRALAEVRRVLKPGGLVFVSTPDRARSEALGIHNPYHLAELTEDEFVSLLRRGFAHVRLFYQDVNTASFLWEPGTDAARIQAVGIRREPDGSRPASIEQGVHRYLVAAAGDGPVPDLTGVCVAQDRRLLDRLLAVEQWGVGQHQALVAGERVRERLEGEVERLRAQVAGQEASLAALRDAYEDLRRAHADLQAEREVLRAAADRLDVILRSRAWRVVSWYWRQMDRAPGLRALKDRLLGRPPGDPGPS